MTNAQVRTNKVTYNAKDDVVRIVRYDKNNDPFVIFLSFREHEFHWRTNKRIHGQGDLHKACDSLGDFSLAEFDFISENIWSRPKVQA